MTAPRVLFYVQHLLGIGHLARASRIADALADDGFEVMVVTGGTPVAGFPGPKIRHLALPAIASGDAGFRGLVDQTGAAVDKAFEARRTAMLLAAFRGFAPDAVIVEAFPFGRRQVRFELLPLLDAIEATTPRPVVLTSLRDILQERTKPGRDEETVALVRRHFDRVLVHGDPNFIRLEETFPLAAEIADRVVYTGLVVPPPPPPPVDRFDIVASAGGGAVGRELIQAAAEAAAAMPDAGSWCLIAGPNLPEAEFAAIEAVAPANARVERFRRDFASLLTAARLSVSQAGYNTVGDILVARCRAILVPFEAGGETEQATRAGRLAKLGLAKVLPEPQLSATTMTRAIAEALALPPPQPLVLELDGARRSAAILRGLIATPPHRRHLG